MSAMPLTYNDRVIIGTASEETFFLFADRVNSGEITTPKWLCRIERPIGDEDARGADAIAYVDRGRIPIQIKSSDRFIDTFWRNHRCFPGFVLIVHPDVGEEDFGPTFLQKLEEHYHSKKWHKF